LTKRFVFESCTVAYTVPGQKFSRKRGNSRRAFKFPSKPPTFFNYHIMIRSPLGSISSNRVHKHEYIFYQRELIHGAISGDLTSSKVQRLYEIPKSLVRDICNAVVWQYHDQSKSRLERPKKLLLLDKRHIIRVVRLDSKIIYRNLFTKTRIDVFAKIVYRLLKEKNIIN